MDNFFKRAFRFGYTDNLYVITEVVRNRDCKLWKIITENALHPLYELLPPKEQRFQQVSLSIYLILIDFCLVNTTHVL